MNIHGFKLKKKKLKLELKNELEKVGSCRRKIINLELKIKGTSKKILELKKRV